MTTPVERSISSTRDQGDNKKEGGRNKLVELESRDITDACNSIPAQETPLSPRGPPGRPTSLGRLWCYSGPRSTAKTRGGNTAHLVILWGGGRPAQTSPPSLILLAASVVGSSLV